MSEVENVAAQQPAAEQTVEPAVPEAAAPAATTPAAAAPTAEAPAASVSTDAAPAVAASEAAAEAAPTVARPSGSLYVGNLSPDVDETMLYTLFSQAGPVNSIRVCRDHITRRSLGYAYANFNVQADTGSAQKAIDTLNYTVLCGRPIRIMWSYRDPTVRRHGAGNLFTKNLDKSIDHKALHSEFSTYGKIMSLKICLDEFGASKGYGFVHFENEENAKEATKGLNGKEVAGKIITVCPFVRRSDRSSARFNTNVYVKNLPESLDEARLRELAAKYGDVTSVKIEKDANGVSKKFGYINYKTSDEANAAINGFKDDKIDGQSVTACFHESRSERNQSIKRLADQNRQKFYSECADKNVFIKFLPENFDDAKLTALFAPFGTITSSKVVTTADGIVRGFGFVCYSSAVEAQRAIEKMNRFKLNDKPLFVALAQRKEVRLAQQALLAQPRFLASAYAPQPGYVNYPVPMYPGRFNGYEFVGAVPVNNRNFRGPRQAVPHPHGARAPRGGAPRNFAPRTFMQAPVGQPAAYQGRRSGHRNAHFKGRQQVSQPPAPAPAPETAPVPPSAPAPVEKAPVESAAPAAIAAQEPVAASPDSFTAASLAEATPEEQKRILGNKLYMQVQEILVAGLVSAEHSEDVCGKITGMLLEMSVDELLVLIESKESLADQVRTAHELLVKSNYFSNPAAVEAN